MSWRAATKHLRRPHKERSQLRDRRRFGLLEKHKDYKLRSDDYKRKQRRLKALSQKASFRNPDEFYFKMINSAMEDGRHKVHRKGANHSAEDLKKMQIQDIGYLLAKKQSELKKVDRLQSTLHCLDATPRNKHTIFVDTAEEADNLTLEDYFDTVPELVGRSYNRPTKQQLQNDDLVSGGAGAAAVRKAKKRQYQELEERMKRKEAMEDKLQQMQVKKNLSGKGKRRKMTEGENGKPPVYKWKKERKK